MDGHRNALQSIYNQMFKLSLVAIIATGLIASSCNRERDVKSTLADIETNIDEHPDSALKAINAIDTNAIRSRCVKAKYALLKSIALDKNYIDTTDTRIIAPAVEYYRHHGSKRDLMRSEYSLGVIRFNQGDYQNALISFSDADALSRTIPDSLYIGLSLMGKADTYNRTYCNEDELVNVRKALNIFEEAGLKRQCKTARYHLGISLQNAGKIDSASVIFERMLSVFKSSGDTNLVADCLKSFALLSLSKKNPDPNVALEMLTSAVRDYKSTLDASQYGELAYAYALTGDNKSADAIMSQLRYFREADYWQYKVLKTEKKCIDALEFLERSMSNQDSIVTHTLKESSIKALGEHYKQKSEDSRKEATIAKMWLCISVLIAILIMICLVWISLHHHRRLMEERDQLLSIAEERGRMNGKILLSRQMREQLGRFRDLCVEYSRLVEKESQQAFLDEHIRPILDGFLAESGKHSEFEKYIDETTGGVMGHLREDMKNFHENDFVFLSYVVIGLDTSTMAWMMGLSKEGVRSKKFRLVKRILESQSRNSELYSKIFTN